MATNSLAVRRLRARWWAAELADDERRQGRRRRAGRAGPGAAGRRGCRRSRRSGVRKTSAAERGGAGAGDGRLEPDPQGPVTPALGIQDQEGRREPTYDATKDIIAGVKSVASVSAPLVWSKAEPQPQAATAAAKAPVARRRRGRATKVDREPGQQEGEEQGQPDQHGRLERRGVLRRAQQEAGRACRRRPAPRRRRRAAVEPAATGSRASDRWAWPGAAQGDDQHESRSQAVHPQESAQAERYSGRGERASPALL